MADFVLAFRNRRNADCACSHAFVYLTLLVVSYGFSQERKKYPYLLRFRFLDIDWAGLFWDRLIVSRNSGIHFRFWSTGFFCFSDYQFVGLIALAGISASRSPKGSDNVAPLYAPAKIPTRVMPTWTVDRNPVGSPTSLKAA